MTLIDLMMLLPLAVLGAVLGLDVVSFPQAMISRPIVAATLAGAFIGQPGRGLVMGVALEFFALESMPFGASRYPEWGSASVVGGGLFAERPEGTAAAMAVGAGFDREAAAVRADIDVDGGGYASIGQMQGPRT